MDAPETTDLIERPDRVYIQLAENGSIRVSLRDPFEGGTAYIAATALSEKDRRIGELEAENKELDFLLHEGGTWEEQLSNVEAENTALRARLASCEAALEEMTPHVAAIEGAIRINDEWGRVIVGQTEAAAEIARIHSAALTKGGEDA